MARAMQPDRELSICLLERHHAMCVPVSALIYSRAKGKYGAVEGKGIYTATAK